MSAGVAKKNVTRAAYTGAVLTLMIVATPTATATATTSIHRCRLTTRRYSRRPTEPPRTLSETDDTVI
ncbi:hypothetical protein GCM10010112_14880 [Actinoplanes lobatus]|nr:hypothetical protein GCM10010112_14880 [Actinoplanes lobatus]